MNPIIIEVISMGMTTIMRTDVTLLLGSVGVSKLHFAVQLWRTGSNDGGFSSLAECGVTRASSEHLDPPYQLVTSSLMFFFSVLVES